MLVKPKVTHDFRYGLSIKVNYRLQFAESLDDFRYVFNVVFNDQGYLPTSALATGALAMGVSPWIANLPLP